jgi:hypothetical protein
MTDDYLKEMNASIRSSLISLMRMYQAAAVALGILAAVTLILIGWLAVVLSPWFIIGTVLVIKIALMAREQWNLYRSTKVELILEVLAYD